MRSSQLAVLPLLALSLLGLAACDSGGTGGGDSKDAGGKSGGAWLADDLDLDSYQVEGSIDGLTWTVELCALNLIPSFAVYFEGRDDPYYTMQFEAYDKDISGGVVTGIWRYDGDVDHPVQIDKGTWSSATSASGQKNGTISVDLQVTDYPPEGGSVKRTVSGALDLTPVVTSDECVSRNDVDYLKEALDGYEGPTGGGL